MARSITEFGTTGVAVSVTISLNVSAWVGAMAAATAIAAINPDMRFTLHLPSVEVPDRQGARAHATYRLVLDERRRPVLHDSEHRHIVEEFRGRVAFLDQPRHGQVRQDFVPVTGAHAIEKPRVERVVVVTHLGAAD